MKTTKTYNELVYHYICNQLKGYYMGNCKKVINDLNKSIQNGWYVSSQSKMMMMQKLNQDEQDYFQKENDEFGLF